MDAEIEHRFKALEMSVIQLRKGQSSQALIAATQSDEQQSFRHEWQHSLANIEYLLHKIDARMDRIEARMDKLDARMDRIEARMDRIESDIADIKINALRLEGKLDAAVLSLDRKIDSAVADLKTDVARLESKLDNAVILLDRKLDGLVVLCSVRSS